MGKAAALALVLFLGACGRRADVVVGSKNFTEQRILGELLAETVESVGLQAGRKLDLGGTFVCDAAIRAGQIDLYVEYTGTALAAILKEEANGRSAKEVLERVREAYATAGLDWLDPLGFDNTFALVMRDDDARRLAVRTISDLVPHARELRAGFGYEFKERADGYPALARAYGIDFGDVRILDLGLMYRALVDRQVDVVVGNSTDGQIAHLGLLALTDDRAHFPPYEAAIVVRRAVLEANPRLASALRALSGTLSTARMRQLNVTVDVEHRSPADALRVVGSG